MSLVLKNYHIFELKELLSNCLYILYQIFFKLSNFLIPKIKINIC